MPVTKKYKQINKNEIICIQKITHASVRSDCRHITELPWKFAFEMKTQKRVYVLFAPT